MAKYTLRHFYFLVSHYYYRKRDMEGTRKPSGKDKIEDKRQSGANKVISWINPFYFVFIVSFVMIY
jgi:hypothetical protein